jgi:glycosyltransferase involved in cell wall biosynthesis
MKIDIIIPTIGRSTLERAVSSAKHPDVNINTLICGTESCAGYNRNKCLEKVTDSNWIVFIDDDDYLTANYHKELDAAYDIVVLRMKQNQAIIPRYNDDTLRFANVGINIAVSTDFYKRAKAIFDDEHGEDWRFIEQLLKFNPKIKVTDGIFYNAPVAQHLR